MFNPRAKNLRKYLRGDFDFSSFTEGDFRSPEQTRSGFSRVEDLAFLGFGGLYLYRGARGAGYFPLTPKFWKSLKVIQEQNIKRFISNEYWKYIGPIDKANAVGLTKKLMKTGFGLRSGEEAITSLFSRSISGLSDATRFLGLEKPTVFLKNLSEKILGGTPERLLGFSKLPMYLREPLLKAGFKPGARTMAGLTKAMGMKVALPIAGVVAGLSAANSLLRGAGEPGGLIGPFADAWVNFRKLSQRALSLVGVPQLHERIESELPGYLRVIGIGAGVISGIKGVSKTGVSKMLGGGLAGFAGSYMSVIGRAFLGGIMGMAVEKFLDKTPEELDKIYSGEQKVPIRKGRWWEFGRTPYEGGRIEQYRPHWYSLLKGGKPKLETAEPMSVGGLFSSLLMGKKLPSRPVPVGTKEWLSVSPEGVGFDGRTSLEESVASRLGIRDIPSQKITDVAGPLDPRVITSETIYRGTEVMGLPGYVIQQMLKRATGSEVIFDTPRVQTPGLFGDPAKSFYDRDLGGMLGLNEIFRRYLPPRRGAVEYYNPIPNRLGQEFPWLPGDDSYINLKRGDPYSKLKMGEYRLPGEGYESVNRLYSGVPGQYSDFDAFMVLSDVAPFSKEYSKYRRRVASMINSGSISGSWKEKYYEAVDQRASMMERYKFYPQKYSAKDIIERDLTRSNENVKEKSAEPRESYGILGSIWRGGMETLGKLPIPGVSWISDKILPYRSAIEHYKKFQVYSKENTEWSRPVRDFIKPYIYGAISLFNEGFIPPETRKRHDIEEYFDKLKYLKYSMLATKAKRQGDMDLSSKLSGEASRTMAGTGPYASKEDIYWSIPKRERAYFPTFIEAKGEERKRILKISPEYMREIYQSQWKKQDEGSGELGKMFPGLELKLGSKTSSGIGAADMDDYFKNKHLPSSNWAGWHPSVDLDDVKIKVVKQEGMDTHDFDLWESQERRSRMGSVPIITNYGAPNIKQMNPFIRRMLLEQMLGIGISDPHIDISYVPSDYDAIDLDFNLSKDFSSVYSNRVGAMM